MQSQIRISAVIVAVLMLGCGKIVEPSPEGTAPRGAITQGLSATGRWHTELDPVSGRYVFVDPSGAKRVLKGVSMTGLESGTPGDASGGGYWMYHPNGGASPAQIMENVVAALGKTWGPEIIRVPICGSAWATPYMIHDWGNTRIMDYREWVDVMIKKARSLGQVVIIDLHLWQIAPLSRDPKGQKRINDQTGAPYKDRVDGCIGYQKLNDKHTCADRDWVNSDPMTWSCTVANAEGVTLQNAHFNREHIAKFWADVAKRYKSDSGVFFELMNEPYEHVDTLQPFGTPQIAENKVFPPEDQYDWEMWTTLMNRWIQAVRDEGGADNVILVNGLMWGYAFHGPIANPQKYLPWIGQGYKNIAYGFHPYQHGTCCAEVGVDRDLSKDNPYHATYCRYYQKNNGSVPLPIGDLLPSTEPSKQIKCGHIGYEPTRPMGMPPCKWIAHAYNPKGGSGLCVGQPDVCEPLTQQQCESLDRSKPEAGGWSRYVLPMSKFGPLISTEFGSFDCSSPFVKELLEYAAQHDISYTAWALWPQNNGGTLEMGMCSYPGITEPFPNLNQPYNADYKVCQVLSECEKVMSKPMRWAGQVIYNDLKNRKVTPKFLP